MFETVAAFAVGIIMLCLLAKLASIPAKLLWKLLTNSIVGAVMLWVISLLGLHVKITFLTALIAGIFGIPGVLAVLILF